MTNLDRIHVDGQKCTGCRVCELICSHAKVEAFHPNRSRIRIVKMERFFIDVPVLCRQCPNAACETACPVGAFRRAPEGAMVVHEATCTGCGLCGEACPFGAVVMDPTSGKAAVCDLCEGEPQCVKWCPTGALTLRRAPSSPQSRRWRAAVSTARSLVKRWGLPPSEFEAYCVAVGVRERKKEGR